MSMQRIFATVLLAAAAHLACAAPVPAKTTAAAPAAEQTLLDINSASRDDLIKQPAIGLAIADKIIAGRPWGAKNELLTKKVLTKAAYDQVSKLIIAKQAPKNGAAKPAAGAAMKPAAATKGAMKSDPKSPAKP